ncbi:MAG: disulfide bond formation protein B, partial [Hydrogenophaga sp.]|nr:disulfide bond formation protein B [Hydrogenophaga sp.]
MSALAPVFNLLDQHPRRLLALVALACVGLLAYGILYLQQVVGLEPCPMCIVQRYALILVAVVAGVAAVLPGRFGRQVSVGLMGALAVGGAFVAARQSFLQWNPPKIMSCGRDFYGM